MIDEVRPIYRKTFCTRAACIRLDERPGVTYENGRTAKLVVSLAKHEEDGVVWKLGVFRCGRCGGHQIRGFGVNKPGSWTELVGPKRVARLMARRAYSMSV